MKNSEKYFPKHACQLCGSEIKLVETIINDEFFWDDDLKRYLPNKFIEQFEHTGKERCGSCNEEWTGLREVT